MNGWKTQEKNLEMIISLHWNLKTNIKHITESPIEIADKIKVVKVYDDPIIAIKQNTIQRIATIAITQKNARELRSMLFFM